MCKVVPASEWEALSRSILCSSYKWTILLDQSHKAKASFDRKILSYFSNFSSLQSSIIVFTRTSTIFWPLWWWILAYVYKLSQPSMGYTINILLNFFFFFFFFLRYLYTCLNKKQINILLSNRLSKSRTCISGPHVLDWLDSTWHSGR